MKKRLLPIILCLAMLLTTACGAAPVAERFVIEYEQEQFGYRDMRALEDRINQLSERMDAAHVMADAARDLGYDDSHSIVQTAKQEYAEADAKRQDYQNIYDTLENRWHEKEVQYPTATFIWKYLEDAGFNDSVIAGIIGNMMVECGGHTLNLQWDIYGSAYYGICQWSRGYPEVWGQDLEYQCKFLVSTIQYELDNYGYMYKKGTNFEKFLLMSDVEDAALCFAKSYERCGSSTHRLRQRLAVEAYNYFVS